MSSDWLLAKHWLAWAPVRVLGSPLQPSFLFMLFHAQGQAVTAPPVFLKSCLDDWKGQGKNTM